MKSFDQNALAPGERPSTEAINRGFSADSGRLDWVYRQLLSARTDVANDRAALKNGFLGSGHRVRALDPATLQVTVDPGLGFYYDNTVPLVAASDGIVGVYEGVSDVSPYRPLVLADTIAYTVPTPPPAGQARYDIIEVRPKRDLADYGPLLRFNSGTNNWSPQSAAAFLRYAVEPAEAGAVVTPALSTAPVSYVEGVAAPYPGVLPEPPTTPGYIKIARILVETGITGITSDKIVDRRQLVFPQGAGFVSGTGVFRAVRGSAARPTLTSLIAPSGVRVAMFCRQAIPLTGFDVNMNLMVFTGQPVRFFTGGVELLESQAPAPGDNEKPIIAHRSRVTLNRTISGADIDTAEMNDPNMATPIVGYADGETYSSLQPLFCAWNAASSLWNGDMVADDPVRFSFWASYAY